MRPFLRLCLVIVGLLLAVACSNSSPVVGLDGGPFPVADGNVCQNGNYAVCGGTCVDIQGDTQNCGACGNACPADQVCTHGACATVCGGGSSRCGGNCVDLKSDPVNCGGCGTTCPTGNVCSVGACALTCQAGLTNCGGACVDLTSDDANCNGCGAACAAGEQCVNSQCTATCQSGWSACQTDAGSLCVDTTSDSQNCGGCGTPCPSGYLCSKSKCSVQCNGGTSQCGTGLSAVCVDENIDPNHCGGCSTVCSSGNVCATGHCCASTTPFYCGKCDTFANCVAKTGGAIVAGNDHTCAIKNGAAYCWGDNGNGQIGTNDSSTFSYDSAQQVYGLSSGVGSLSAGAYFSCAIVTGGAVQCWGDDSNGALGDGTSIYGPVYAPVGAGISSGALHAAGSGDVSCILLSSGAIDCSGYDGSYEIANGLSPSFIDYTTPTTTNYTSGSGVVALAGSGADYGSMFCAVLSSGKAQCWGTNFNGLGDGSSSQTSTPVTVANVTTATNVATASDHACLVTSTGALECWGYNFYGTLGDGTATDRVKPVAATVTSVQQVAMGYEFTCVLTTNGAVECVGYNSNGQLGNGKTSFSATKTWQTAISSGAIAVAAGYAHACALKSDGSAWCWGANGNGQLGNGSYTDSSSAVKVSGF